MELSALHYALRYSQYEMIQELLQYGDMKDKVWYNSHQEHYRANTGNYRGN